MEIISFDCLSMYFREWPYVSMYYNSPLMSYNEDYNRFEGLVWLNGHQDPQIRLFCGNTLNWIYYSTRNNPLVQEHYCSIRKNLRIYHKHIQISIFKYLKSLTILWVSISVLSDLRAREQTRSITFAFTSWRL